ncbi:uncharacterized protein LOC107046590 [Diachasma alloeum]|uniref:uncharacterized protein LOC107046590 n=1 Tax=Diachasma alloeum TaxID=454923 RepID=UPI0007384244|nr:uncharacterized protein LOC107046590 [Diachasma alloeum]
MDHQRICNLANPEEENDATSLKILRSMLKEELRLIYNVTGSMGGRLDGIEMMIESFRANFLETMRRRGVSEEKLQERLSSHFETIQRLNEELTTLKLRDIFSKYAWAVPTKTKNGKDVSSAIASILEYGRVPQKLHVDRGKEFYNSEFKKLMQDYGITMYSTFSNLKASICERFNRTLKEKMWKQFSLHGTYEWIPIVKSLLLSYNDTKHGTIWMKPKDVTAAHEKYLLHHVYGKLKTPRTKKIKFKVGDKVRVSKYKNIFGKGYIPNRTTEIVTISEVLNSNPVIYKLIDYKDQPIEGGFYQEELTKITYPDVYLVEKILRRRGNKVFIKWLGFDNSHNSWIDKDAL